MVATPMENPPLVTMENGRFSFGQTSIFRDVSLAVEKGEVFCLLGPNGCGKTTLIDCILGIHPLDKGDIHLAGTSANRLSPRDKARIMAYVPQKHDRHFSFSVLDVLLMGRSPYTSFYSSPGAGDIEKADGILAAFGLSRLAHRDYTRLSGGETQLVMIMRALIQDTPVIVMDEPTAHLDFRHELIVLETIVRLVRDRGLTLIMATHFPNHAFYFENEGIPVRVAFMHHGRVHTAGSPTLALTEDNLAGYYQIRARVIEQDLDGRSRSRHIIPIRTLDPDPLE